jgi:2-keto-4-pentenoate hydratase/2-oxohepta-3-ene-1,7-dioic acid hydratase in catechol pathway
VALDQVELQAPVPAPDKMIKVGLNFYDHAKEMGIEVPEDFKPSFFWKGDRNCIVGPMGCLSVRVISAKPGSV